MSIEGSNTILNLATTTQAWTSAVYGIKPTGRERKTMDSTVLTDTDHNYVFSSVKEPGSIEAQIRFDPKNEPAFDAIETITVYYPPNGTAATYTALTNRPSCACAGGITKVDLSDIKIESLIEATITIKLSGARTVFTGAV